MPLLQNVYLTQKTYDELIEITSKMGGSSFGDELENVIKLGIKAADAELCAEVMDRERVAASLVNAANVLPQPA